MFISSIHDDVMEISSQHTREGTVGTAGSTLLDILIEGNVMTHKNINSIMH